MIDLISSEELLQSVINTETYFSGHPVDNEVSISADRLIYLLAKYFSIESILQIQLIIRWYNSSGPDHWVVFSKSTRQYIHIETIEEVGDRLSIKFIMGGVVIGEFIELDNFNESKIMKYIRGDSNDDI